VAAGRQMPQELTVKILHIHRCRALNELFCIFLISIQRVVLICHETPFPQIPICLIHLIIAPERRNEKAQPTEIDRAFENPP
jgi:hypothetical protein